MGETGPLETLSSTASSFLPDTTLGPFPITELISGSTAYQNCVTDNRNYTDIYKQAYGGIFLTFGLNVAFTLIIILIFSFIRKGIGGYARLGVTIVRSGLPNIMHTVTERAQNARHKISEAGHKIRHSRIVTGNVSDNESNTNTYPHSVPRMRGGRHSAHSPVIAPRRGTVIAGVEGEERATLPNSDLLEVGDTVMDMGGLQRLGLNNNIERDGGDVMKDGVDGDRDVQLLCDSLSSPTTSNEPSSSCENPTKLVDFMGEGADSELEKRRLRIAEEDERRLFSWLKLTLSLNISDFGHKVNQDAVQYLHFQRHVIGFMLLNTIFCMLVLLPINIVGGNQYNSTESFGRMTLNNLEPTSNLLVVHSVYAFVVCVIILAIMDRFEKKYVNKDPSLQTTILVKNFPIQRVLMEREFKNKPHLLLERLETYFTRVLKILPSNFQIYLTFDVSDLEKLVKSYAKYTECIDYVVRKHSRSRSDSNSASNNTIELGSVVVGSSKRPVLHDADSDDQVIQFEAIVVDIEKPSSSKDVPKSAKKSGSPSPSEIVEKSYVVDSKEIVAKQNGTSKRLKWGNENQYIRAPEDLKPVSNYSGGDTGTSSGDSSEIETKIQGNPALSVNTTEHISPDDATPGPSHQYYPASHHAHKSNQSPKVAIKRASLYIRESVNFNQLNLRFNKCCAGFLCPFCNETRNAFDYYSEKREEVVKKIVNRIKDRPFEMRVLPMFFITLPSKKVADTLCNFLPYEQSLFTHQWEVSTAPNVDDIIWENLSLSTISKRVRWCIAQVLFIVLFLFISTPSIVIGITKELNKYTKWRDNIEKIPMAGAFVGPLIFVILAALLPFLILLISDVRGFSTTSRLNFYNYRRVFVFLFFMILVLPSIGLTNIQGLIKEFVRGGVDKLQYNCIFYPDNGAFFVNYVISASMIGLMAELLRIADMLFYLIMLILMKSKAERKYVKKQSILQFPYGYCYAFQLLAACVVIVYSPICPIIAPFGLFYSLMRHYVDRYNLYFSFEPSKLNQDIHKSSTVILLSAAFLSLIILFIYSLIKMDSANKLNNTNSVILLILIIIVVCYWTMKKFFYMVNSVSKGVIETSSLIRQASQENILDPSAPDTTAIPPVPSSGNLQDDFSYTRTESEPIIDSSQDGGTPAVLSSPARDKSATIAGDTTEPIQSFFSTPVSLRKQRDRKRSKTQHKASDFQLNSIAESQKYLPPIYHLLKSSEISRRLKDPYRPRNKSWFSQGPDKNLTGSMRTVSKSTSSSAGNKLDVLGKLDPNEKVTSSSESKPNNNRSTDVFTPAVPSVDFAV